jgi:hypothetical protein
MNEQHTVGPWAVNWAGSGRDGVLVYDEVYVYAPACGVEDIAVAADIADPITGKPSYANACLIAAAPDLLANLERMVQWYARREAENDEMLHIDEQPAEVRQAMIAIARALPQGAQE